MTNQPLTANGTLAPASRVSHLISTLTSTAPTWSAVVLRVALAIAIFPHGAQKLLGLFGGAGFSGTIAGFQQYFGIAAPFAVLAIITEFFAPIALALGAFTRIAALGLVVQMLVASHFHLANGFFMNWYGAQAGEGIEYHILAIGIGLALVVMGGGRVSLDRRISEATRS